MLSLRRFSICLAALAVCLLFTQPAVAQNKKLTLSLNPNSVSGGGTVSGSVSRNGPTGTSVTVSLSSSIAGAVTMPASVTIAGGQSSTSFNVTAGTNPGSVTITASADGHSSGSAGLTITAPSTPPPLVRYNVVWLGDFGASYKYSNASSANIHGEIVGLSYKDLAEGSGSYRVATRFTPNGPVDLNEEMADLLEASNTGDWPYDGDWIAYWADDINDLGQIVGTVTKSTGSSWAYIYDPGNGEVGDDGYREPSLNILPRPDGIRTMSGRGINNFGEIIGEYRRFGDDEPMQCFTASPVDDYEFTDMGSRNGAVGPQLKINDLGQMAIGTHRYTPPYVDEGDVLVDGVFDIFPFRINSINVFGEVGGYLRQEVGKRGRNIIYNYTVYRALSPDALETIYQGTEQALWVHINDYYDVAFTRSSRLFLYRDGIGEIDIDTTVVDNKWENARQVRCSKLMNPLQVGDNQEFPIMIGYAEITSGEWEAFYLFPDEGP